MAGKFDGQERRAFGRRTTRVHALLLVPGRPASPCVIRNYSVTGAMLELSEDLDPPFNVKIRLFDTDDEIECEVRHCRERRLGVEFTSRDAGSILATVAGAERRRRRDGIVSEPITTPRAVTGAELRKRVLGIG